MFTLHLRRGRLLWGGVIGLAATAVAVAAVVFWYPAGLMSHGSAPSV